MKTAIFTRCNGERFEWVVFDFGWLSCTCESAPPYAPRVLVTPPPLPPRLR